MMTLPEKPSNSRFTDHQWQAIYDEGKNILVSASAGSGKTTVLVQRVIEKIKEFVNVNELLVVTYTNAAAREMKERIQSAIQSEINKETDPKKRQHLIRQIPLLGHADISTLHSFCLKVIRRYYYLIDFDPVFRLLTDETEKALMQEEVWDALREELYGEEDTLFETLAASYSNDRNDDGLTDLIFSLYNFSRANPKPLEWLSDLTKTYHVPDYDLGKSFIFTSFVKPKLLDTLETIKELLDEGIAIGEGEEELEKVTETMQNERQLANEIEKLLSENSIEEIYSTLSDFKFKTWSSPRKKTTPEEVKEAAAEMKNFRDNAKDLFQKTIIGKYFPFSPSEQIENMTNVKVMVEEMARVATLFYERYQEYKASRKVLDFNDLEHLTLSILVNREEEIDYPTEASVHYRQMFSEVMVDEYQDINLLQETILKWLTKDEPTAGNQFMVGDVKQSIYSFRLADPSLFIDKYERYASGEEGERIILAENFRSTKEVLSFTNFIFEQLMNKEVGDLEYDEPAQLVNGFKDFPESDTFQTDILLYETEQEESEEEANSESSDSFEIDTKTKGELFMTANKILSMVENGLEIYDKEEKLMRPIQFKDIVLLTPTKMNNIDIQEVFKQLNIPVAVNETQNYFRTTEISIMMSLLKIIDNPQQDIPLVAVLRSPIVDLDEVELTRIRLMNKESSYYDALRAFVEKEDWEDERNLHLRKVLTDFLNALEKWRKQARRKPLVELIWMLYEETGFLHYVSGMSSGIQRKANLHALYERAASYEKTAFKGLFQFIQFIEKMQKKDKDLAEPSAISDGEDAVRVMTIHASKGLEFPVVFVLDMSKRFNLRDSQGATVFDETYGVGAEYRDLETREKRTTLPETALKYRKKTKLLSEQMRVLYVALTRAEQKLILVGSYKNKDAALKKWELVAGHQPTVLPDDLRLNANSFMDWVGRSIIRHKILDDERALPIKNDRIHSYNTDFTVSFYNQMDLEESIMTRQPEETENWYKDLKAGTLNVPDDKETKEAVANALELMNKPYVYQSATQTTSYQSVSEIKRLFEEPDDGQMVKIDVTNPRQASRYVEEELSRPRFISESLKPTPAEIGQATHLVLQALDLKEKPTKESIESLIQSLASDEVITEEMASLIKTEKIQRFFETEFGLFILNHVSSMRREVPFSLLMEASDIFHDMEDTDDNILIHGIVDGFIEQEEGIILFDYKTDQVKRFGNRAGEVMLDKYRGQLTLYKRALESILDKPVLHSYIVLLDTSETIEVV